MRLFLALVFCLLQIALCKVDKTWWKYTTMYQVFLPSFKDGNGDGMGDLKGLNSKLDYFVKLGIETVYITPHFESPMVDSGYDITNYTSVNPLMGTMDDFDTLMKETNERGLRLVIDIVMNHCSDQHPWFIKSINREKPYDDYFIWKDPKGYDANGVPIPPNNWKSIFEGSMWEWNNQRKQFYLHQFAPQQPDFNLRNKATVTEFKKIFKFWFDKGVAGFRMDAVKNLLEDALFRDEPPFTPDMKYPYIRTCNHPDSYKLLYELRKFLDKLNKKVTNYERIIISEDYVFDDRLFLYYGTEKKKNVHVPLNFHLATRVVSYQNATFYHNLISDYLNGVPKWATPSWNAENHDKFRKAYILNEEIEFVFVSMVMLLPGFAFIYYGQEIGSTGAKIRPEQGVNNFFDDFTRTSRDYFRHPMPWDDSLNGGFSTNNKLYLPLNPNYWRINVKAQKEQQHSYYHMFEEISKLKKTKTFKFGDFKSYVISTWVYAFLRSFEEEASLVIFNLGSETEFIDVHNAIEGLPRFSIVQAASPNSGYKIGDKVPTMQEIPKILVLRPFAALVLDIGQKLAR